MKQVNETSFLDLLKEDKPLVCDFFATWCGPCKMLAPIMEEMSAKYGAKANFCKVDVDENNALAGDYGIMSIPTVIVFKNGQISGKQIGFMSKSEMDAFLGGQL